MPDTTVINQPLSGNLGDFLVSCLEDSTYEEINIVVAFAKNSGVLRLKSALEHFKAQGSKINVYVGIDFDGTSYEALVNLYNLADQLHVVHTESGQTFHSKIYNLKKEGGSIAIVGSNNLTAGGLWTNLESCSIARLDLKNESDYKIQDQIDSYISNLVGMQNLSMQIRGRKEIDRLLQNGYISKEASVEVRREFARKQGSKEQSGNLKLFIKSIKASLPSIKSEERQQPTKPDGSLATQGVPALVSEPIIDKLDRDDNCIWFETRKMTGGSRNILDLSKKSLVHRGNPQYTAFSIDDSANEMKDGVQYMKGGVQFFGVDPSDTDSVIDITINYDGVDYDDNTILYPVGDKANGTWRLQFRGVSSTGEKIGEAIGKGGLVNKVLVFTKIKKNYFSMSIYDDSDLQGFIETSKVVAYNGISKTSRYFGLW